MGEPNSVAMRMRVFVRAMNSAAGIPLPDTSPTTRATGRDRTMGFNGGWFLGAAARTTAAKKQ
jgi:hypothetical protein